MSKRESKNYEIKSPMDCLNIKFGENDPRLKECMYFMNQLSEEEDKICHNESCDVAEHEKARQKLKKS